MSLYTNMAATAKRLLTKFGRAVTITTYTTGTYNTATGAATSSSIDTATIGAVFSYKDSLIDGALIKRGDKYMLCPIAALVGDRVTIGTVIYSVIDVKEINPGGTPVMYKFNIRGIS